jgi:hypothetical protein
MLLQVDLHAAVCCDVYCVVAELFGPCMGAVVCRVLCAVCPVLRSLSCASAPVRCSDD